MRNLKSVTLFVCLFVCYQVGLWAAYAAKKNILCHNTFFVWMKEYLLWQEMNILSQEEQHLVSHEEYFKAQEIYFLWQAKHISFSS